jgi:hypothetical protein
MSECSLAINSIKMSTGRHVRQVRLFKALKARNSKAQGEGRRAAETLGQGA